MSTRPTTTQARPYPRSLGQGRYTLLEQLGQGGIATVWRALDSVLGLERALKLLDDEAGRSPVFRSRFLTEARVMARLEHPNILRVYDYGHENGRFYLVMDLAEEGSVTDLLRMTNPLPEGRALRIAFDVLKALVAVHGSGAVHRDVKPGNVLVGPDGHARLADFGIVRLPDQQLLHQTAGDRMGTAGYIAPEAREDGTRVSPGTDLFAVGATLFAMLTGRHPSVLERAADHPEYFDGLHAETIAVIRDATGPDEAKRYKDARGMARAVVRAYDALSPTEGPVESLWMRDLETAWSNTFARLQASATRPPAPLRDDVVRTSGGGIRRREARVTPAWTRQAVVQQLTLVFGITAAALAVAVIAILLSRG